MPQSGMHVVKKGVVRDDSVLDRSLLLGVVVSAADQSDGIILRERELETVFYERLEKVFHFFRGQMVDSQSVGVRVHGTCDRNFFRLRLRRESQFRRKTFAGKFFMEKLLEDVEGLLGIKSAISRNEVRNLFRIENIGSRRVQFRSEREVIAYAIASAI